MSVGRLERNALANMVGFGVAAVMPLVFIPFYVRVLGIGGFGLIGFAATLLSILQVLDFGMTAVVGRQVSRAAVEGQQQTRDLVRTLEVVCLTIAFGAGALVLAGAGTIAKHWIRAGAMPLDEVHGALLLMGFLIALQWPAAFYQSGLAGAERHVPLNVARAAWTIISHGGGALVLLIGPPRLTVYLAWQILTSGVHLVVLRQLLWRALRGGGRPTVRVSLLRGVWRLGAEVSVVTALSLVLMNLDRAILSKLLTLEEFGLYVVALTAARSLSVFVQPVFIALFPRLSALVATGDASAVEVLYRRSSQFVVVVSVPWAVVLALFSRELVTAWTGSTETADATATTIQVLVLGTALNGILYVPYALQLARGWLLPTLVSGGVYVCVLGPAIVLLASWYGGVGAAAVWAAMNLASVLVVAPIVHRRLLGRWYPEWFVDVALPAGGALAVGGLSRILWGPSLGAPATIVACCTTLGVAGGAAFVLSRHLRRPHAGHPGGL